ncbi:alpha/beta family hydrolase [Nocardioides dongkuii]|uniref:alpha/beta hydrolase family protein n=1 Tax=Nocardioides dongkuii TaxID=2760089 RepID=UPI0015FD50BB|nr:alpha/beta family hydrolase [Nocardioides dongkuii]
MSAGPSATGPVEQRIDTPHGEARLMTYAADSPTATLLLSHGAGGGVDARDLVALAGALPALGLSVVLLEQPWRVAGRKLATPPPTLDAALLAAVAALRDGAAAGPLVLGGRSAGARSAARCATRAGAAGCLALSFPLHPPGRPERSRLPELLGAGVPVLVVQGERDTMGTPDEFPPGVELSVVPDADHGLRVPARAVVSQQEAMEIVVESALEWVVREVAGNGTPGPGVQPT